MKFVAEIVGSHAGIAAEAIRPAMNLREDLGLDSVDAAGLLIQVEETLGVRFELEGIEDIETVEAVVTRLVAATAAADERVREGVA